MNLTRSKKLRLNTTAAILFEVVTIMCGFITPRLILASFGSEVNGLVSSITQFLGFITLADCGVGAVVQAALYKPLAQKDEDQISRIFVSSERFFRKVTILLGIYMIGLVLFYPRFITSSFDRWFTVSLILVISVTSFAQFFLGITSRMLLTADQLGFIGLSIQTVSLILNTIGCYVMINMGASIHAVKIMTSVVFLMRPVALSLIARKKYQINRKIVLTEEPIKQKWNGLAQHVASVVLQNTAVMVLTVFSTLQNISIYSVYYVVLNGIKTMLVSATNGTQAMIGNMLAQKEDERLQKFFSLFEWLAHLIVTIVFCITGMTVVPFVQVYTRGITDANYIVMDFAVVMSIAQACYCLRIPYNTMVLAAGHFKQTQLSAILEAVINVVVSILAVLRFGLVGVAIGMLVAMLYRTFYFIIYLSRNIIYRKKIHFFKHMATDIAVVVLCVCVVTLVPGFFVLHSLDYQAWIVLAIKTSILVVLVSFVVNLVMYRQFFNKEAFRIR